MGNEIRKSAAISDANARKYKFIFMGIGLAIITGGLWWLYEIDAPYHPALQGSDSQGQIITDS